jgi:hypothetical protein
MSPHSKLRSSGSTRVLQLDRSCAYYLKTGPADLRRGESLRLTFLRGADPLFEENLLTCQPCGLRCRSGNAYGTLRLTKSWSAGIYKSH